MLDDLKKAVDHYKELDHTVIIFALKLLSKRCHENSVKHGFWGNRGRAKRNVPEMIALMHSELSEMLEAYRHDNPPSEHVPEISGMDEELADLMIRVFDFCGGFDIDIAKAIELKMKFNETREHKHGKVC